MTCVQLDPLNIEMVMSLISKTSSMRVLFLMPSDKRKRFSGALLAYTATAASPELEYDMGARGAVLVGYYTKKAEPAAVMADLAAAMAEL